MGCCSAVQGQRGAYTAAKKIRFFVYFFGEPAILFVDEAMTLLAKARRALCRVGGVVAKVKGIGMRRACPT
jgi:hypothetical protein